MLPPHYTPPKTTDPSCLPTKVSFEQWPLPHKIIGTQKFGRNLEEVRILKSFSAMLHILSMVARSMMLLLWNTARQAIRAVQRYDDILLFETN